MKRWAGLLLVLVAAAVVAWIVSVRMRPSEWERRHAMIRVGMTRDEVALIMHGYNREPGHAPAHVGRSTSGFMPPKSIFQRDVLLEVHFGDDDRVVRTTVDGVQVEPPYKWGNP